MNRLGAVLLGVVTVLTLAVTAPVARAADGGTGSDGARITHFEQTRGGLSMLVSVPANAGVDLDRVAVSIEGRTATATARDASSGVVRRTAILAIDTSTSMSGAKFAAAKTAALQYVKTLPDDVYLGIVTFGGSVATPLSPTRDRDRARATIGRLTLSPDTLLYDGLQTAVDASGHTGQRSILVLSDGADTQSTETLGRLSTAISKADVLLDVVAVDQSGADAGPLSRLAAAGKGQVLPADPAALAATFAAEASVLARQVLVTATLPTDLKATEGTVTVTLPSDDGATLSAAAFDDSLQPRTPAPAAVPIAGHGYVLPSWVMYAGVAALGVGLLGLLLMLLPRRMVPESAEDRVASYTRRTSGRGAPTASRPALPRVDAEHALASATTAAAGLLQRNAGLEARIARSLDAAGSDLKPAEWLLLHLVIAVAGGLLGLLVGAGNAVLGLLFLLVAVIGPWLYLRLRGGARRRRFYEALPETLQLMSGSLSAGLSLTQSVDTVVREGNDPIAGEFRRALVETRLGVEVEDALAGIATRFDSADFAWMVMAIRIQRQVGGNLAELLDTVAATLRERQYIRRQVGALSAEGKLSAVVIASLPPLFTLYLLVTNRSYLHPLLHDPRGVFMVVFGVLWLAIGIFWMTKLVKVEV